MICPSCRAETTPNFFCHACDAYLLDPRVGSKAGVARRLVAHLLDALFFAILLGGCFVLLVWGTSDRSTVDSFFVPIFVALAIYLLISAFLWAGGETLGKCAVGIRVVDKNHGLPPGIGRMLLRETLGKFVSAFFLSFGYFWAIWDRDGQAWHDKIAGTLVVKHSKEPRNAPEKNQPETNRLGAYAAVLVPLLLGAGILAWVAMRNDFDVSSLFEHNPAVIIDNRYRAQEGRGKSPSHRAVESTVPVESFSVVTPNMLVQSPISYQGRVVAVAGWRSSLVIPKQRAESRFSGLQLPSDCSYLLGLPHNVVACTMLDPDPLLDPLTKIALEENINLVCTVVFADRDGALLSGCELKPTKEWYMKHRELEPGKGDTIPTNN